MARRAKQSANVSKKRERYQPERSGTAKASPGTAGISSAQLLRDPGVVRSLNPAQRHEAVARQQGLLGNKATAGLVQRQSAEPGEKDGTTESASSGKAARPMMPAYRIVVNGKTYYMTPGQYSALRKRTTGRLRYFIRLLGLRIKSGKETHEWWLQKQRGWMGVVADMFAGISPPSPDIWEVPHEYLIEAQREVDDGNLDQATPLITTAQQKYNQVREIWDRYQERTRGGARMVIKTLEITRDVAFAVAGALGTVAFTPVGAGLLASAGVAGLVGGGLKLVQEWATKCAEMWHNVRSKWDIAGSLLNIGVSAIGSFAGALVTGPLSDLFFKRILSGFGDDVLAELASELKMPLAEVRRLFAGRLRHYFTRFVSGASGRAGTLALQSAIKTTAEAVQGKNLSAEQFSDKTAETFTRSTAPSQFVKWLIQIVGKKKT